MKKFPCLILGLFLLSRVNSAAGAEPQGMLLYHEPVSTYTEAFEYRSFRQDNALYATLTTPAGEAKKLKSGGVLAVLPYPPADFDSDFASTAKTALAKIGTLQGTYPSVQAQLERVRGKWARALSVFEQQTERSQNVASAAVSRANSPAVTASVRSSSERGLSSEIAPVRANLTSRIEAVGRRVIGNASRTLEIEDRTFSVWTFFVILPALIIVLLFTVICMALRPPITKLPPARPSR